MKCSPPARNRQCRLLTILVIGIAAIVPHNAMADSLMDEISAFVEENTDAEILEEIREER